MGGRSGSRTASHTHLVRVGPRIFALTRAQHAIVRAAQAAAPEPLPTEARHRRSLSILVTIGAGTYNTDNNTFTLNEGVHLIQ